MLKKFAAAAVVLVFVGGVALAAEHNGTLQKVNRDGDQIKSIVVKVDDKDMTFTVTKDTQFISAGRKGKEGKALETDAVIKMAEKLGTEVGKGDKKFKYHPRVTVTTDGDSTKATKVQFRGGRGKGGAE
jgi:hypothetical protein